MRSLNGATYPNLPATFTAGSLDIKHEPTMTMRVEFKIDRRTLAYSFTSQSFLPKGGFNHYDGQCTVQSTAGRTF